MHELKIHSYPPRKVRVPETCANATIFILVILCGTAKKRGEQYSKRILPPFLAPYCVIRRDGVLDYLKRNPAGTMHYRMALSMLGALDKRTIRRHLEEGLALIGGAAMQIAELLSQRAFFGTMPPRALGETEVAYLEAASEELSRAARRAAGARGRSIPCLVLVHIAGVSARHRGPPKVSTTCVLRGLVFCGSS